MTRIFDPRSNTILRNIKQALTQISFTGNEKNAFILKRGGKSRDILGISFKELYILILTEKQVNREWESKWEVYLGTEVAWEEIEKSAKQNAQSTYKKRYLGDDPSQLLVRT